MSPGEGLRPPPPPLLTTKGHPSRRWKVRDGRLERQDGGVATVPKPSPVVAGRPLRVSNGGGRSRRRRPGDMERKGLPAATGPIRLPRRKANQQNRSSKRVKKKAAQWAAFFDCTGSAIVSR